MEIQSRSAPTSPWRSTTSCPARPRTPSRSRGWSGRCGGWIGARRGMTSCCDRAAPANPLARRAGRHPRRPPPPLARRHARARPLDRRRHRRALGRRAQAGDAPRARAARPRPAPRDAPLSYGCRLSRRSARGDRSRRRPVRLRRRDPERPARDRVAADRPGQRAGRGAQGIVGAARSRVRLRDLHHLSARLPAASLRGRGHAGAPAGLAAQHPLSGPAGGAGARAHPGRDVRRLEPRVAPPPLCSGT